MASSFRSSVSSRRPLTSSQMRQLGSGWDRRFLNWNRRGPNWADAPPNGTNEAPIGQLPHDISCISPHVYCKGRYMSPKRTVVVVILIPGSSFGVVCRPHIHIRPPLRNLNLLYSSSLRGRLHPPCLLLTPCMRRGDLSRSPGCGGRDPGGKSPRSSGRDPNWADASPDAMDNVRIAQMFQRMTSESGRRSSRYGGRDPNWADPSLDADDMVRVEQTLLQTRSELGRRFSYAANEIRTGKTLPQRRRIGQTRRTTSEWRRRSDG